MKRIPVNTHQTIVYYTHQTIVYYNIETKKYEAEIAVEMSSKQLKQAMKN